MPRIRRWFHVSHDINSDPEVWEMREKFGDRSLGVWLEILSIADRYAGLVPGDQKYLSSCLAAKCKTKTKTVEGILKYASDREWLVYDPLRRVRNYSKYRPTREHKQIPDGEHSAPPPHTPHIPHDTKKTIIKRQAIEILTFLNEKTGRSYQAMDKSGPTASLKMIMARLNNGATLENCRGVIARKARQWKDDPKMEQFLRPATLFAKTNFEQYMGERDADVS